MRHVLRPSFPLWLSGLADVRARVIAAWALAVPVVWRVHVVANLGWGETRIRYVNQGYGQGIVALQFTTFLLHLGATRVFSVFAGKAANGKIHSRYVNHVTPDFPSLSILFV